MACCCMQQPSMIKGNPSFAKHSATRKSRLGSQTEQPGTGEVLARTMKRGNSACHSGFQLWLKGQHG